MIKSLKRGQPEKYQYIPLDGQANYFYTLELECSAALINVDFKFVSLGKANHEKSSSSFAEKSALKRSLMTTRQTAWEPKSGHFLTM
jgi:hypothetical protein